MDMWCGMIIQRSARVRRMYVGCRWPRHQEHIMSISTPTRGCKDVTMYVRMWESLN